ncbi:MAG TPA: hypothetical protein ENN09_00880 [Planctomycetes bacterium]|nr:hypothetical protein [Planctomycetota bacterium]
MITEKAAMLGLHFWSVLGEMSPYLLLGFLVAGVLSVIIPESLVEKHLGGNGLLPILKASFFGVPLPLCSCGVIPVAASLKRSGAGPGAVASFLISTPQTGVDSILVTLSLLGPLYAVFRPVAAFISGLVGGALVTLFGEKASPAAPVKQKCCENGTCGLDMKNGGRLARALRHGFITLPRDIAKSLLAGLAAAALITAFIPDGFFVDKVGGGFWAYLVMLGVGIPLYVCATSSVPIAAALVLTKGLSPGAALVFLMTGPATNAASITTLWNIMGKRSTLIYLASVAGTALASGVLLDHIFAAGAYQPRMLMEHVHGHAAYEYAKSAAALVLLSVLGAAVLKRRAGNAVKVERPGMKATMFIKGMTCEHCAGSVKAALESVAGVKDADVDLGAGRADVHGEKLDIDALRSAVGKAGYTVAKTAVENTGAAHGPQGKE